MNNSTVINTISSKQYRPHPIYRSTLFNNRIAKNRIKSFYSPIIHDTRPRHAQSLLIAVLELLRVEATAIGLEKEAAKLASSLLGKNNYPQRK